MSRKPVEDSPSSYIFRIGHVNPTYSFGTSSTPSVSRFDEYAHTEILATCIAPPKVKGRETQFTILGDRAFTQTLGNPDASLEVCNGIGTLTMRGTRSQYFGAMPFDALMGITPALTTGALEYIILAGPQLSRGSTRIRYMSFLRHVDPDDY
jgi:hypothetical protein